MIDSLWLFGRLVLGLAVLQAAGYALLVWLLPARAAFTSLERLSLAWGLGCLGITLWMLLLGWLALPFSWAALTLPWLAVRLPAL